MGLYIKGMEMPINCFYCPLSVLNGERLFCEVTKDEVVRAKKPGDCPLVEVPPHGRLIIKDGEIIEQQINRKQLLSRWCARCDASASCGKHRV